MNRLRDLVLPLVAALAVGGLWATTVPPFEAPDESFFYKLAFGGVHPGEIPSIAEPLFLRIAVPPAKAVVPDAPEFDAIYNPAFRFVSNRHGHVNMFVHGERVRVAPAHVRRLAVVRAVAVLLLAVTVLAIHGTAAIFFERRDLALLVSTLALCTPQFAFMGAVAHPDIMATTIGALVALVLTAHAKGHLSRGRAWPILLPLVLLVPLTDRQAYFLAPLAPLGMAAGERSRRAAGATLVFGGMALLAGGALAYAMNVIPAELALLRGDLAPAFSSYWARPALAQYYVVEFAPKLFFGFWGWLGQPSILLPAPLYGILAAITLVSLLGIVLGGTFPALRERVGVDGTRALAVLLLGAVSPLAVVLLAHVLEHQNLWYGRWLFPMMAAYTILFVVGLRTFGRAIRAKPRAVAATTLVATFVMVASWVGPGGVRLREAIAAHHYGDQAHLATVVTWLVAATSLLAAFLVVAAASRRARRAILEAARPVSRHGVASAILLAAATNLTILFGVVRPLYEPLSAADYLALVQAENAAGEGRRAASLASIAVREYPRVESLQRLAFEAALRTGDYAGLRAYFEHRLSSSSSLSRDELLGLARMLRVTDWGRADLVQALGSGQDAAALEATALVRRQLRGHGVAGDGSVAAFLDEIGAIRVGAYLEDRATIEGYTARTTTGGRTQVVVYFSPYGDWDRRRLWVHAYPPDSHDYIDLAAEPPPFTGWIAGELAWEVFYLPDTARYNLYAGVNLAGDLGPAVPLGWVGEERREVSEGGTQ